MLKKVTLRASEPALQWSRSQQAVYDACHRARYYSAELAPTGWQSGALEIARSARRLKTLTALPLEVGRVLHERAAECSEAVRASEPLPSIVQMRQRNAAHLNCVWFASRDRRADWVRNPRDVPMLREVYYGRVPTAEQLSRVKSRVEAGLVTLRQLSLWSEIAACDPRDILVVDKLQCYVMVDVLDIEPVRVWAAPDLVMRSDGDSVWEVIDFKSSTVATGAALQRDIEQVISYAVYLRHGARVLGEDDGCRGRLVYLGDGTEVPFAISARDIDAAEKRIRDGARAMHIARMVADAAADDVITHATMDGISPREVAAMAELARRRSDAYPMTTDRKKCRDCPFVELCAPEQDAEAQCEIAA